MKTISVNAVGGEGFRVDVAARSFNMIVDQPEASGGKNEGPNPLEYTLGSLAACMVTIGTIVAKQDRIALKGLSCKVEGDLHPEVFMGKDTENRAGFVDIRMEVVVDADMTQAEKQAFVEKVEARCPVSDALANPSKVHFVVK